MQYYPRLTKTVQDIIVLSSNSSWSIYNFRREFCQTLKNKGFNVFILAPKDEFSLLLKKDFNYIEIKHLSRKGKNFIKDITLLFEYLQIYNKLKPSIVINFTIKPNIYSSLACRILKIKCISVITGLGFVYTNENLLTKMVSFLYKIALKRNEYVVFQNEDDLKEFLKRKLIKKEQTVVIKSSGVNINCFSPYLCRNITEEYDFMIISRLLWNKGIGEFIEAIKELKKEFKVKSALLGPIDKENPLAISKSKVLEWQKEGLIEYLGYAKDVRPYICKTKCVVLPSYYKEGVPRILLEAMAMGKPIITTNMPGCKETVENGVNGYIVEPRNTKSLYNAMKKILLLDEKARIKMGLNGREKCVKEFNIEKIIKRYLDLIESIELR